MASAGPKFSTDAEIAISRQIETSSHVLIEPSTSLTDQDLHTKFYIPSTVEWVASKIHKNVALQFPDELLPFAKRVCQLLEAHSNTNPENETVCYFIMADTSYGSCCVDIITAAHVQATAIVHYGDACLSKPPSNIDVYYVLITHNMSVEGLIGQLNNNETLKDVDDKSIMLITDLAYRLYSGSIIDEIQRILPNCTLYNAIPVLPTDNNEKDIAITVGRYLHPEMPPNTPYTLLFIGAPQSPLLPLWLLSYPFVTSVMAYDPIENKLSVEQSPTTLRSLRKRLYLIERIRDAQCIGIVCGGVTVANHLAVLQRLQKLCTLAGKRHYVLSIGKLNVPKLANFADHIDAFVLISCPYSILMDNTEHVKPVVSVFEAEIALNPQRKWVADSSWIPDFGRLLSKDLLTELESNQQQEPDVSLVTGKIRVAPEPTDPGLMQMQPYEPDNYLANRSWQGLENKVGEDVPIAELKQGRSGIASVYETETS